MSGRHEREKGEGRREKALLGNFSFGQDLAHVDGCIRVDSCAWWAQQKRPRRRDCVGSQSGTGMSAVRLLTILSIVKYSVSTGEKKESD